MKKYVVELREVHVSYYEVEAENEEHAVELMENPQVEFLSSGEYSYPLDDEPIVTLKIE